MPRCFRKDCGVSVDPAEFRRWNARRAYVKSGDRAPLEQEELLRRAYALGGMVDQYLTALYVMEDPWIHEVSQDPEAVIDTLTTLWKKGLSE